MKAIVSRAGTFRTGDEIADAIMTYSLALARHREVDVVDFPFISEQGSRERVQLMIGWMADAAAVTLHDGQELYDEPLIKHLTMLTGSLDVHGDSPLDDSWRTELPEDY
jgi:hypothetical protein